MINKCKDRRHAGFTLIEILVTLVVLSIGLLGIAGMQAGALKNNHAAYTKTQATNLAMDMADRIRANSAGSANYDDFDSKINTTSNPGCIASASGCTTAEMAQYDLFEWSQPLNAANKPILSEGRGLITENGGEFTITIAWREAAFDDMAVENCGITDLDNDGDDDNTGDIACFQMSFIP